nr:unnamed protein product [Callosobruchus analis]
MMDILEEMKQSILTALEAYRRNQYGLIRDKEEVGSRQLIVKLEQMDFSAYEANQKNVSYHPSDPQTNQSEALSEAAPGTQCKASYEDEERLGRGDILPNENHVSLFQSNSTPLEIEDEDVDTQSHDLDQLLHEAEDLRYTYYQIDTGGNLANPTDIYFVPRTNVFGNQLESTENQNEVVLHTTTPEGDLQLHTNSVNHEIDEQQINNNF